MNTKEKLRELVSNFRKWLSENYTIEEIEDLRTDDPGYPAWDEISSYFSELLVKKKISNLDKEDQTNLLYLISRNWDIGQMIAWLSKGNQLSNLGDLDPGDFIMLSKTLLELEHPEFNDAKSQFISAFKKFNTLTDEIESILLKFYYDQNEYTKRIALLSLGKLGYSNIRALIKESWKTIDDEYHKMACLSVIYHIKDDDLMEYYLAQAKKNERQHLKAYVAELRKGTDHL